MSAALAVDVDVVGQRLDGGGSSKCSKCGLRHGAESCNPRREDGRAGLMTVDVNEIHGDHFAVEAQVLLNGLPDSEGIDNYSSTTLHQVHYSTQQCPRTYTCNM